MIEEKPITLTLNPDQPIDARIVALTPDMADEKVMKSWWEDECLKKSFAVKPIDRYWDWNKIEIEAAPIVFEDVFYTPMELPAEAAQKLLAMWEA